MCMSNLSYFLTAVHGYVSSIVVLASYIVTKFGKVGRQVTELLEFDKPETGHAADSYCENLVRIDTTITPGEVISQLKNLFSFFNLLLLYYKCIMAVEFFTISVDVV